MPLADKHPTYIVWEEQPLNAEPPLDLLTQSFVTPLDLFYTRNHGPIPTVTPGDYRLAVGGLVGKPLNLSLDALRAEFPKTTLMATLQCAGNRRAEALAFAEMPGEVPWDKAAISNGVWGGVLLRDVLDAARVERRARHVAFTGLDHVMRHGEDVGFGGSIPVEAAQQLDVLLAYEMNDAPLTSLHGGPLRVVAPGYIGARSIKWLKAINLQTVPSSNYFQAHAYKLFPPHINASNVDWAKGLMLGELSVTAVIVSPQDDALVTDNPLRVQGYAMAGGQRTIARVDVSADGGETWQEAHLQGEARPGIWSFWEAQVTLSDGPCQLVARAWDSSANTQPESVKSIWNFKGYMNNAWHRVNVRRGPA